MRLLRDAEVRAVARELDLAAAVGAAFAEAAAGRSALQPRQRIAIDGAKLSTMAAILPGLGVAGAKVYTTVGGRFAFVVLLFDAASGAPLACLEADAFTEFRTAAVSEVVAAALGPRDPKVLAVFGTGVQAGAHARAFARRFALRELRVVSRGDAGDYCARLGAELGIDARPAAAADAVAGADLVVTATRSKTPLFDGAWLAPGALVTAVGSTLPDGREIDGATLRRAAAIVIEDPLQTFAEAGDLRLAAADGDLDGDKVLTLADALADPARARPSDDAIVVFESVGIALEDVAVAAAIYRAIADGPG